MMPVKGRRASISTSISAKSTSRPASLSIWSCNATGTYSGYVGTDPDAVSAYDDRTMRSDGTTDDETFLRGISKTNEADIGEFRTIFAGYYSSRMTHIHATVQTNLTNDDGSYSDAATKHVGQLFFPRELINSVYQLAPYYAQLTFNLSTVPSTMRIRFALLLMTMGTML
ncbi:hypothetical protein N7522_005120 [Penicillium canescens]|uniref:uncharacterized protein n=1 Tax=Penicillium canescens TaxID=5083 RepID=UPI0026DFE78D|nr:uncharacterized protein N7446_005158 [Penicillium canescens]KAJ6010104.1 hypothetical protein N7522_005120 [Penicillium canescens]KAJ6068121.1 hypothetical protein N7446_005158 [Penicillium canescens]